MDIRCFLTCFAMWLCSIDGYTAIQYAYQWLKIKFA